MAVLTGLTAFYWFYQEWFSWFAFVGTLCLPVAALLLSLPAMLRMELRIRCPAALTMGTELPLTFDTRCALPAPDFRGRICVTRTTTGERWRLKPNQPLPAEHCGQLVCRPEKTKVYDYLGLFWLRIQKRPVSAVIVRPTPVPIQGLPDLERYAAQAWRPKAGGGYSENHELRLYRPGDNLNQVHWKLSVKTGKYIVREAMEPQKGRVLVEMVLRGTSEALDRKFGNLLWLSGHLLQKGIHHELRVLTAEGVRCLPIAAEADLEKAMDALLCARPAAGDARLEPAAASWQYRIGGAEDEA